MSYARVEEEEAQRSPGPPKEKYTSKVRKMGCVKNVPQAAMSVSGGWGRHGVRWQSVRLGELAFHNWDNPIKTWYTVFWFLVSGISTHGCVWPADSGL